MKLFRVLLLAVLATRIVAQTPTSASIGGIVVKWGTSEPIPQAVVELRNPTDTAGVPLFSTATRSNGEYVFPQVPPGRYRIVATRNGFAPGEYGRKRISGTGATVTLSAGQMFSGAQIELAAGASVSGRVSYANGEPMPVARVQIRKLVYRNGKPELSPQQSTYTNDLGEYRLFWLAPGSYYVSAENAQNNTTPQLLINPNGNSSSSWSAVFGGSRPTPSIAREYGVSEGQTSVTTFYPGATSWENASLIELRGGGDATNINITLSTVTPRRIRGVVLDSNRKPSQGIIVVSLRQADAPLSANPQVLQFFPNNGKFEFAVTTPGSYELTTTVGESSGRAVASVRDRDIDVSISLLPLSTVKGRVIFDGPAPRSTQQGPGPNVILRGSSGQLSSAIATTGEFSFQNVPISNYRVELAMASMPDAYLKSVRVQERDLPDGELQVDGFPRGELQILATRSGGSLEVRVVGAGQQPAGNATVVVLPEGKPVWSADRFRSATVDDTGMFHFRGLPAGRYHVYAWSDVDDGAWFNPAFLANYDSSRQSIAVVDGQKQTVEIAAVPAAP
jgi:hypothetical protein